MMTYNQYEMIDGTLEMMTPAPSFKHQKILTRMASASMDDISG